MADVYMGIKARIVAKDSAVYDLTSEDIIGYKTDHSLIQNCIPFGVATSAQFELSFVNKLAVTAKKLLGAKITVQVYGLRENLYQDDIPEIPDIDEISDVDEISLVANSGSSYEWIPLGVWYVNTVDTNIGDDVFTAKGYDVLGQNIAVPDSILTGASSKTYGAFLSELCSACNVPYVNRAFINSDRLIAADKLTLEDGNPSFRYLVSCIAAIAGGFARINGSGYLEIGKVSGHKKFEFNQDNCVSISSAGEFFSFIVLVYTDHDDQTIYADDRGIVYDDPWDHGDGLIKYNTALAHAKNIFLTSTYTALVQDTLSHMMEEISDYYMTGYSDFSIDAVGALDIQAGDAFEVNPDDGFVYLGIATSISHEYSGGGIRTRVECSLPTARDGVVDVSYGYDQDGTGAYSSGGGGGSAMLFSQTEVAVGKWIDGETVYQKTLVKTGVKGVTSATNVAMATTAEMDEMNIDTLIRADGVMVQNNGTAFAIPGYYSSSRYRSVFLSADHKTLIFRFCESSTSNTYDIYITVLYTKA